MSQLSMSLAASAAAVQRSTAHASLAALGVQVRHLDLFGPVRDRVHIAQKTVRYTPTDKLYDAFIALLAGAAERAGTARRTVDRDAPLPQPRRLFALARAVRWPSGGRRPC